jgi:predicted O-linked N-acetylglucosamine transferase (SPINDLY family)
VGIISEYLCDHTIGKLNIGLIQHLNRKRFDVVVFHTPKTKHDSLRLKIDALADKSITLPRGMKSQQDAIIAEELDVLFYPDIGMAPSTYALAFARLAPVQATSWGHPDTTGLDTMDYFISAKDIEPNDADEHYTERLIMLPRLPCFYPQPEISFEIPGRQDIGLPEGKTLYCCPQSLFKFHPDFDAVLAAIAEGDPEGCIVLLEGRVSSWADCLRDRWARTAPLLLDRAIFLPQMPHERFMAMMSHADVQLDPIHFGGGNTMYEAMVFGTPAVTWPGQFMRGRLLAGRYAQMGVADAPIAKNIDDYAPLALALGRDPERRRTLRKALQEAARHNLFSDTQAVRDIEAFFEAAVVAATKGQKLPSGWVPNA